MGGLSEAGDTPDQENVLNVNVGVLGHVDSGKTSLVKTLSTLLSTAALDKSKQSRQRGMTLDLGFSCFFLDMPQHLQTQFPDKTKLQMTLVDCPGHASLIRTIIGGAQIIDMVLLVVDAFKGWQAQTTECLVLAELTSPHLVVALNKVDCFEPHEREASLERAKNDIRKRLQHTRFADAPLVGVAACVGGEKVAATDAKQDTLHMDQLVHVLQSTLPAPKRNRDGAFYFSIDHCFQIKGRGTVLTGTVLNGSISVNQPIELPTLGLERKVKSMQMFKKQVQSIGQGDRAGICVGNLDAKLLERGIAATPSAVQLLKGAVALVRKVKFFPGTLTGGQKFHISVGHATIMATVTFWGARELAAIHKSDESQQPDQETSKTTCKKTSLHSSSLGGNADIAGLPYLPYDFHQDFLQQDGLLESLDGESTKNESLLHWAMFNFQTPVHCPLNSLVIGSRLDTTDSGSGSSCRLAFSGRLIERIDPERESNRIRLYTLKEKRGVISRLGDPHRRQDDDTVVRYEVFGSDLFKKETNMKIFVGMKVETEQGDVGEIKSSFGTSGKFRVYFPAGAVAKEGDALILRFKRFAQDPSKTMHQDVSLPPSRPGTLLVVEKKKGKKRGGKASGQSEETDKPANAPVATGEVSALKGDVLENGKHSLAIIAGLFTPEVNIRERIGTKITIPSTNEEGTITGPFGKAGKCKVSFESGISAPVGAKAELRQ